MFFSVLLECSGIREDGVCSLFSKVTVEVVEVVEVVVVTIVAVVVVIQGVPQL